LVIVFLAKKLNIRVKLLGRQRWKAKRRRSKVKLRTYQKEVEGHHTHIEGDQYPGDHYLFEGDPNQSMRILLEEKGRSSQ
jgi:hypothetical protein